MLFVKMTIKNHLKITPYIRILTERVTLTKQERLMRLHLALQPISDTINRFRSLP